MIQLHIAATCLHYGQACFEGLKAFSQKSGGIAMFRPQANAQRLMDSARRIVMQAPGIELFTEACAEVIRGNLRWVPPYGTGASLYVRPLLIGTTPRVGLRPADEFLFLVLCTPVGPYYKDGFVPVKAYVQMDYDRAAPRGVGNVKVAGNYAAGLLGGIDAKKKGYAIDLYLDSAQQQFIDEFGTSNFLAVTKDGRYITPLSQSVLPSITNDSLLTLTQSLGLKTERRRIRVDELSELAEVGACGTAAVITPIYSITVGERTFTYGEEKTAGQTLTRLYTMLQQLQYGEAGDPYGWMVKVAQ
jgi:branched-chain amino acid aminotransferase